MGRHSPSSGWIVAGTALWSARRFSHGANRVCRLQRTVPPMSFETTGSLSPLIKKAKVKKRLGNSLLISKLRFGRRSICRLRCNVGESPAFDDTVRDSDADRI